jgi:hypothetical protein
MNNLIDVSHIRCPLCGKDSALSTFNPEDLDMDIYIRQAIRWDVHGVFLLDQMNQCSETIYIHQKLWIDA